MQLPPKPSAATINLAHVTILAEIVIRAGNVTDPLNRVHTIQAYEPDDRYSNDVVGLSVVFHVGASLDELARTAAFPNAQLGYTTIGRLTQELAQAQRVLVLFVTPTTLNPDHHTLAFAYQGVVEQTLKDPAHDALIRALTIVSNPYQTRRPRRRP